MRRIQLNDQERPADFTGPWVQMEAGDARLEAEYVRGVPNGIYRYWLANGVCIREGFKKNGVWHGTLTTRGADGTVLDVSEFDEGTGIYRIFCAEHWMTDEYPLVGGKVHGAARFWRRGELVLTMYYVQGECSAALCEA